MADLVSYAVRNMQRRKLRTWLTILSIVIGISSFVALVTIGDSFKQTISGELEQFGKESVIIMPGSLSSAMSFGPPSSVSKGRLYEKDIEALKSVTGIERITPMILAIGLEISYSDESFVYYAMGIPNTLFFQDFPTYNLEKGRGFSSSETNVAILGSTAAENLFSKKLDIGSSFYINNEKFRVVGILEKIGGTFGAEDDMSILIPLKNAKDFSEKTLEKDEISYIFLKARKNTNMVRFENDVRLALRNSHKVLKEDEDFTIVTYEFVSNAADMILGTLVMALGLIATIALIVGGIGIMNTMYMSVMERTRELGTLKAVGALNKDILLVVLIESGFLGLVGGIIGVIIGLFLSCLVCIFAEIPIIFNPALIFGSILISFIIGLVSGYFPAKRAVVLSPTEALRYE
ncbi:ABC transporter permease [Candidatus Micrarchaeota archaeon]|nr:ABC transporter permease [Candidatus Micrarchaeota archaeon]